MVIKDSAAVIISVLLASWWLAVPIATYNQGTSSHIHNSVIASPYVESNTLLYEWTGSVNKSCPIVLDRYITTSEGVIVTLQSSDLLSLVPMGDLGIWSQTIRVETPVSLPPGHSTYHVTERPRCTWLQWLVPPKIEYPIVEFFVTIAPKE